MLHDDGNDKFDWGQWLGDPMIACSIRGAMILWVCMGVLYLLGDKPLSTMQTALWWFGFGVLLLPTWYTWRPRRRDR